MADYPFLPADAKTTMFLSDIREQIDAIRSALDAVDELAARLESRAFEVYFDNCPKKHGSVCQNIRCIDCWTEKMEGR